VTPQTIGERIVEWAVVKIGVPLMKWLTPAVAKSLVAAMEKTSDEAKIGLVYAILSRWLGKILDAGPAQSPIIMALIQLGVKREHAVEIVGNFLTALDNEIQGTRPN